MCCAREETPVFLKICYWNIHGWNSKIVGNKLVDPEFLQKVSKFDIVTLSELFHKHNNPFLEQVNLLV